MNTFESLPQNSNEPEYTKTKKENDPTQSKEREKDSTQNNEREEVLSIPERIQFILKDPECKPAVEVLQRSGINLAITGIDALPGRWGEAAEMLQGAGKLVNNEKFMNFINNNIPAFMGRRNETVQNIAEKIGDTTPNISTEAQVGWGVLTAIPEFQSNGEFPSFAGPALFQLGTDLLNPEVQKSLARAGEILLTGKAPISKVEMEQRLELAANEF